MRRLYLVLAALVVVTVGGYLAAAHFSGGALYTFGLPIGGDGAILRKISLSFWEDIQFKDFKKAARYHTPVKQETVDIPHLIQRLFIQKPEALDIMDYEVMFVETDSTQLRSRVKCRVKVKTLADQKIREQEVMFYFHRKSKTAPWYMELEDSLRHLEGAKGKKS